MGASLAEFVGQVKYYRAIAEYGSTSFHVWDWLREELNTEKPVESIVQDGREGADTLFSIGDVRGGNLLLTLVDRLEAINRSDWEERLEGLKQQYEQGLD